MRTLKLVRQWPTDGWLSVYLPWMKKFFFEKFLFLEVAAHLPLRNIWGVKIISIAFVSVVPSKVQIDAVEEGTVNPTSRQNALTLSF
tara:strand:+ start:230 stop:490 length:261 start_codon:yes stop_codon:yes gene_type:complete